jgi:hypothetical protein
VLYLVPPEHRSNAKITSKILLGIPFYGYEYPKYGGNGNPILGPQYIDILQVLRISKENSLKFNRSIALKSPGMKHHTNITLIMTKKTLHM